MKKEDTIEVLNSLITINNDRIEGYKSALDESEEIDLKNLFSKFIITSKKCKQELILEVKLLGGKTAEGTNSTGKLFRVWIDVKVALTGKDRKALLNSCDFGEKQARDIYDKILKNDFDYLNAKQHFMVNAQKSLLKSDREHLKLLRFSVADA